MRKVIKDNRVAIVLSNGSGSFWGYNQPKEWNYLPELVELVQSKDYLKGYTDTCGKPQHLFNLNNIIKVRNCLINAGWEPNENDVEDDAAYREIQPYNYYKLNEVYYDYTSLQGHLLISADNLVIEWVELNRPFVVQESEYGRDYITYQDQFNWEIVNE